VKENTACSPPNLFNSLLLIEVLFLACRTDQMRASNICLLAGMSLLRRIYMCKLHITRSKPMKEIALSAIAHSSN